MKGNPMNTSEMKEKLEQKLPEMLPKAVKWVITHLLMLLYHFRMPIWVTALKAKKAMQSYKAGNENEENPAAEQIEALPGPEDASPRRRKLRRDRELRRRSRRHSALR